MYGVHLVEREPPDGEEAVQWHLLTTVPVAAAAAAAEVVRHYLQCWRVEDFFRVLKSVCRAEHLAFRTADRLQRARAINSVIAWRLMVMTLLGWQVPACAAELLFTDGELGFLGGYARRFGLRGPEHLGAAVRLVAHQGRLGQRPQLPVVSLAMFAPSTASGMRSTAARLVSLDTDHWCGVFPDFGFSPPACESLMEGGLN